MSFQEDAADARISRASSSSSHRPITSKAPSSAAGPYPEPSTNLLKPHAKTSWDHFSEDAEA